jgi:hypothetical protein
MLTRNDNGKIVDMEFGRDIICTRSTKDCKRDDCYLHEMNPSPKDGNFEWRDMRGCIPCLSDLENGKEKTLEMILEMQMCSFNAVVDFIEANGMKTG